MCAQYKAMCWWQGFFQIFGSDYRSSACSGVLAEWLCPRFYPRFRSLLFTSYAFGLSSRSVLCSGDVVWWWKDSFTFSPEKLSKLSGGLLLSSEGVERCLASDRFRLKIQSRLRLQVVTTEIDILRWLPRCDWQGTSLEIMGTIITQC